jgi:hypothetical protein
VDNLRFAGLFTPAGKEFQAPRDFLRDLSARGVVAIVPANWQLR